MTPQDSRDKSALASLPTVLHGNTSESDEPPNGTERPNRTDPENPAPTPSNPSSSSPSPSPEAPSPSPSGPASSTSPSSTTGSTSEPASAGLHVVREISETAGEVVDSVALPAVQALGVVVNRLYSRRTGDYSQRWLFTADESDALAGALGRMAARRLPEQLVEGEGGDLFLVVGVTGGYLIRNALGITEAQMAAAQGGAPGPIEGLEERPPGPRHARREEPEPADEDEAPEPQGAHVHVLSAQEVGAV